MNIIVRNKEEAGAILAAPNQVRALISIHSPKESNVCLFQATEGFPCNGFDTFAGDKLELVFDDITHLPCPDGYIPPIPTQIKQALEWVSKLDWTQDGDLLIHCSAGKSRSAAIAWLTYVQHNGSGSEESTYARLLTDRPIAKPNKLMLKYGDSVLGSNTQDYLDKLTQK